MTTKPNILLITLHDTGRWFGCYGYDTVHTPTIDRLAAEGTRCANFIAASPVCSPSRGALTTGRYPQSNGLMGLLHPYFNWRLHDTEIHLGQHLRNLGYHSQLFNIQHEQDPDGIERSFDVVTDITPSNGNRATAHDTARAFDEWLSQRDATKPFYAQMGFFETHTPFDFGGAPAHDSQGIHLPEHVINDDNAKHYVAQLQGAVHEVDKAIQRICDALDSQGLKDDTIVVFTVDHGVELPQAKWHCTEAGHGVGFIVRWPNGGINDGGVWEQPQGSVDLFPTLMELIGHDCPDDIQGTSFAQGLISSHNAPKSATPAYAYSMFQANERVQRAVTDGQYNLILNFAGCRPLIVPTELGKLRRHFGEAPAVELHEITQDPYGLTNLADDPQMTKVRERLLNQLHNHLKAINDPILAGPVVTPFYQRTRNLLPD